MSEKKEDKKTENNKSRKPVEVYAEKAETKAPELSADEMKALALAYAKYLNAKGLTPGDATFVEPEELGVETGVKEEPPRKKAARRGELPPEKPEEEEKKEKKEEPKAETKAEKKPAGKTAVKADDSSDMKELAAAYARHLLEAGRKPGEKVEEEPVARAEIKEEKAESPKAEKLKEAEIKEEPEEKAETEEQKPEDKKEKPEEIKKEEKPDDEPAGKKMSMEEIEKAFVYKREEADRKSGKKRKAPKPEKKKPEKKQKTPKAKKNKAAAKTNKDKKSAGSAGLDGRLAAVLDVHDRVQDRWDESFAKAWRGLIAWLHKVSSSYRNSYKTIGVGVLILGVLAAGILILFDSFTVYEYAYNGKVLGYVKEQEEVIEVLDVAGDKLSQNRGGNADVVFVANQNVTFNPVDGRGRSTDDMDTAVNKLIYMTDIETEGYAVCDGDSIVAIVKDNDAAERLLADALSTLSRPDSGMELVSAEFTNELSIKPVNVLLSSVQSSNQALKLMTKGGSLETFHIVEEGETIESIAEEFGVEAENIYDENNEDVVTEIMQGDKVCIRSAVEPVSVKMVETGKMKETIEYETVKKKSDEYYQGDTHLEQEGRNGTQIFEGTLTKVDGEVVDRDEISTTVIKPKQDKVILIGTKERPKTAPTGTYALPLESYVVTSEFGGRWGRMHTGIDLGASTGTPIYASDGGTIIRAGWFGGYGNCIDVDHENGRVTRYGHCSAILVSVGDKVYQGQEIGLVGNTGNSFGSHLHFEVILDGSAVNPRSCLDF